MTVRFNILFNLKILLILFLLLQQNASTQPSIILTSGDSITIAANPDLQAGGFHRFLFGSQWRDVWATAIKSKLLHLDDTLIFDREIIHLQENSTIHLLLLKDKNRNEYIFTPFIQDSASSLPSELTEILPQDIVADQISTLNPFASLVAFPILKAVDLTYREAQLVTITNDKTLLVQKGLGILEDNWQNPITNDTILFDNLITTSSLIELLEDNPHNRVDELQYLKARLIDIYLNNWERSSENWRWYKANTDYLTIWKPIPILHRQALVRINGLLPTIADYVVPEFEHCGNNISSIENLTLSNRFLDRRILISYPKQVWDSLANWIQLRLSDSLLTQVISNLPLPVFEKEGETILNILKSRRNQLLKATGEFYKLSSTYVDINCSNLAERAEILRIGRHMVSVSISKKNDASQSSIYKRLFNDDVTKEIRILLNGGDDITTIEGEENSTIKIIADGGEGRNEFVDRSKSRSLFGSVNPFSASGVYYYDNNPESKINTANNSKVIRDFSEISLTKVRQHDKYFRDWGSEWSFSPWLDINPDDGLFLGGGPVYTEYAYRTEPYAKQISIRAGLATQTMRYRLDVTGEFRDWFHGIRTFVQLHASQLDLSNFFGVGNETLYSHTLNNLDFYKVDQRQIFLYTALDFTLAASLSVTIGSTIKLIDNNPKPGTLLNNLSLPYYNKSLTFLNLNASIQSDSRDNAKLPSHGYYVKAECSYLPKFFDNENSFYKLKGEVRSYFTNENFQSVSLAFRVSGEKIWGDHPFFESAFLGGNESLRGFERQRFAGDASIMGGLELRTNLAHIPFIVPLWLGITGFAETGRVFLDNEQSNIWHNVIGGGFWFSFIKSEYVVNFSVARSEEQFAFYATMGFMF